MFMVPVAGPVLPLTREAFEFMVPPVTFKTPVPVFCPFKRLELLSIFMVPPLKLKVPVVPLTVHC